MTTANSITSDDFHALEQKVLRAVEVLRREREARATAEANVTRLEAELADLRTEHTAVTDAAAAELDALRRERADVRQRVETMLRQMDELV